MNDVSNTALITLKCHLEDIMRIDSILQDRSSIKAFNHLDSMLDEQGRKIMTRRVRKSLVRHIVLRAKKYDEFAERFLKQHPEAVIVNIGCGLDHRFGRIDNGTCTFFDLDFPDIIRIKRNIFPGTERYRQLGKSVFDFSWLDEIPRRHPVILLAEGVFMYCQEKDVASLLHEIHLRIPGAEMAFEVFSSIWLTGWRRKVFEFKLRNQLKFGKDAAFQFGITDSDEIEKWSEHYKFMEDWSYFDVIRPEAKDFLRKIQWTVYYRIG